MSSFFLAKNSDALSWIFVICWKITDLLCHNFFTHLVWSCAYRKNCEDTSARNFPLLSRVTKKLCWLYSSVTIVTRLLIFFMWKRLISSKAAIKAQAASELTSSYDGHDTIYGATWWNLLGSITWPFLEGGTLLRTRHSWWWQSQQTGEIIGLLRRENPYFQN